MSEPKVSNGEPVKNVNTVLLYIVISVCGFIAVATISTMLDVAAIKASQVSRAEITAQNAAIQLQIVELAKDFNIKTMELNKELQSQRLDLTKLQIQMRTSGVEKEGGNQQ